MIKKLSQEVVNQIAAGEVIERPSSVVKELLDNAIDSGADKIDVKIKGGGIKYIEVADNGSGVAKDDMKTVFEAHTTSKIQNLEDLNEILSMGFRGEALSTIVSVAQVSMVSKEKDSDYAYKVEGKGVEISKPQKTPRNVGTTVIVENLFKEIPARLKYLRAESTEYRKILEILIPYFLIYPNIHFTFEHNSRSIHNLPKVSDLSLRIPKVLKSDFTQDMLPLFFDGEGMKISGYVAKPKYFFNKTIPQYIFINKRPIFDKGIAKAVSEGFQGYIPEGKKVPFVLNLEIKTSLVDVNVHPKKEEVRFMNPFRVYVGVEDAVKQALSNYSKEETSTPTQEFRDKPREINYKKESKYNVSSGLKFSEQLLKEKEIRREPKQVEAQDLFQKEQTYESDQNYYQIFNKFIIVEYEKEVWILDQHAASERIYYEKITKHFENDSVDVQNLLIPVEIKLSDIEALFIKENKKVFQSFGFTLQVNENVVEISQVPSVLVSSDYENFFKDLVSEFDTKKDIEKFKKHMISVMACHASVRAGQKLDFLEMKNIVRDLKQCENSTTCPHGRPIIWKISEKELDKKFDRT